MIVETILARKGTDVACIAADASVADSVELLCEKRIGALVVTDAGGAVAGVISERDLVRGLNEYGTSLLEKTVADLMTADVHTVTRRDKVNHLMTMMTDRRIRHLPVLKDNGELVGVISIGDVVKSIISDQRIIINHLEDYITGKNWHQIRQKQK
jgi:CBS domain-containing protein